MSSIGDILDKRKFVEPEEVAIIKKYVRDKYEVNCSVIVRQQSVTIGVPSAALAGTLRHDTADIESMLPMPTKKIHIRISG